MDELEQSKVETDIILLEQKTTEIFDKITELRNVMIARQEVFNRIKENDPDWIDHVINRVGKLEFNEVEIYI